MKKKKPLIPPTSLRYCHVCNDNKTFIYNKVIGHSLCVSCGGRFASRPKHLKLDLPGLVRHLVLVLKERMLQLRSDEKILEGSGMKASNLQREKEKTQARIDEIKQMFKLLWSLK